MSKIDKTIANWRQPKTPREVKKNEVLNVLKHYNLDWEMTGGSHMVVRDERLVNKGTFGKTGEFSIPVSGGQKVKYYYIKSILNAIDCIEGGNNDEVTT